MRIDMICGTYPPDRCGVADYTRRLARELREQGADVEVITTVGRDSAADPDVPAHALAEGWRASGARRLARKLRERRADLVHIQFPTQPYHGKWGIHLLPGWLGDIPVVTTLHEYCMAPPGGRLKQLLMARLSTKTIVTQDQDRRLLKRWFGQAHLRLIPIGSNIDVIGSPERGRQSLDHLGGKSDGAVFLFFGFVRPGKGLETLFHALSLLPGGSSRLLIVAPEPEPAYQKELQSLASELGISDRIFSSGYLPDSEVSSLMLAADAAVLPFEDGATPRRGSLLAALSHGLPVITTRSEHTPQTFSHRANMLLSTPRDPQALAANMRIVMECAQLKADISHGAAFLSREFSWPRIAEKTRSVYLSAIGGAS